MALVDYAHNDGSIIHQQAPAIDDLWEEITGLVKDGALATIVEVEARGVKLAR